MVLKVDRATFLSLAFGMAGSACNTGQNAVVAANVVDIPPQPPQPLDAGVARIEPRATAEEPQERLFVALDDGEEDPGDPTAEGSGAAGADAETCGFVDPKKITRPTSACSEDQGTAGSCSVMKPCRGFAFPREQCESYKRAFKPKVAQRMLDCVAKLTPKQVCDACSTYRCGELAMKSACPDPSADAPCAQITAKCKSVSMTDCQMYLSGMSAVGRAKMTSCLTSKSGCGFGIFSCAESL